jgi:hypothetical protein
MRAVFFVPTFGKQRSIGVDESNTLYPNQQLSPPDLRFLFSPAILRV